MIDRERPDGSSPSPSSDPLAEATRVVSDEDRRALDAVFSEAYEELRRLATRVREGDPSATLSPTALVNEAWLKLADSPHVARTSRLHFRRIAARAMRQVLIEAARRRKAEKRGGGSAFVTFEDSMDAAGVMPTAADELLALDEALDRLATLSPRQSTLVEARFFGGLELKEAAALLEISEATAVRDWRTARAWLATELRSGR
ncbi:MAG: sigma-70 family RNA polymerase sigma factor [Gemmatimonadaceae bacterium]|nr:sigma-70 family RNA polymerase sigma factor [Gemmatimonadaceae bacterium]